MQNCELCTDEVIKPSLDFENHKTVLRYWCNDCRDYVQRRRKAVMYPERSKREEDDDAMMKRIEELCCAIIELRSCGALNTQETE